MGNSTISVQNILDRVAAKAIPTPLMQAAGYGTDLAVAMANDVMGDLIAERFNWKWNRAGVTAPAGVTIAPIFHTNSYQQDYPRNALTDIGWIEDADRIDINNTAFPKPLKQLTVRRQLSRSSLAWGPVAEICWMYNKHLTFGTWPGPGVTYYSPITTGPVQQNSSLTMIDSNDNFLALAGYGTTGLTPPVAPVGAPAETLIADGTAFWTVVDPEGQGFRVSPLPGAAGPVWQIIVYYQMKAPVISNLQTMIDPIPDDFSRFFQQGMEAYCLLGSPNPGDKERGNVAMARWMKALDDIRKQGDREADSYALLPATSPVENVYSWVRNPQDPSQPY